MDLIKNNYLLVAQIVSRDDLFCMISDLKVVKSELAPQFGEHLKICREASKLLPNCCVAPNEFKDALYIIGKAECIASNANLLNFINSASITNWRRPVTYMDVRDCILYKISVSLAPTWNFAGDYLVNKRDFYMRNEFLDALKLWIKPATGKNMLHISLQPVKLKLSPLFTSNLPSDSNQDEYVQYINDRSFKSMKGQIVYALPSLAQYEIVSMSTKLPTKNCGYKSYEDMRTEWKLVHGYELPQTSTMDYIVFCTMSDKTTGETVIYPHFLLKRDVQEAKDITKLEGDGIVGKFVENVKQFIPSLFEEPLRVTLITT